MVFRRIAHFIRRMTFLYDELHLLYSYRHYKECSITSGAVFLLNKNPPSRRHKIYYFSCPPRRGNTNALALYIFLHKIFEELCLVVIALSCFRKSHIAVEYMSKLSIWTCIVLAGKWYRIPDHYFCHLRKLIL